MTTLKQLFQQQLISRLENRALLRHLTGLSDSALICQDDYVLTTEQQQLYHQALARLTAGEPLAYIIGYKEFYSRKFSVTPATLIPRPETELVVATALQLAPLNSSLLDLGTGSGCIAISCKLERPDLAVTATDLSLEALAVAAANANHLNAPIKFIHSDWFAKINGKFALIATNPPYIEINDQHLFDLRFEPQCALTDFADGLSQISRIVTTAINYLLPGGWLIVEHGYNQAAAVRQLCTHAGLNKITTIQDYAGIERVTFGQFLAAI